MNEIDDDYVFHPNDDCSASFNHSNCEEIIYRKSFFDIDTSGSHFLNHLDFIVEGNSSHLNLPPEDFNFPPGYRRVVHVDKGVGEDWKLLGTGSALPEVVENGEKVQKRIVHKVGDLFDTNFSDNVEVKESTIPNVIKLTLFVIFI